MERFEINISDDSRRSVAEGRVLIAMRASNTEPVLTAEPLHGAPGLELSAPSTPWLDAARRWLARHGSLGKTVATSFAIFALTALQSMLLARLLGPEVRGEYAAAILYSQTLLFIGLFGAPLTIARRAARGDCHLPRLRNAATRFGLFTGCATAGIVALLSYVALPAEKRYLAPWCGLAAVMLPFEQIRLALLAVEHGRASFRRYNAFRLAAAAAFPVLLAVLWLTGNASLTVVIVLTIVAPLIGLALQLVVTPGIRPWREIDPQLGTLAREGLPYAAENLVGHLYGRLDMLLILWLVSNVAIQGEYAAAIPAASILVVAANSMELFAFNAGARAAARLSRKRLVALGAGVALMQIALAAILYFTLEPLMMLVYGEKFRGAVPFALALLPAFALGGCGMVAEGYLRGRGRPGASIRANAIGVTVVLISVSLSFRTYQAICIPWSLCLGRFVGLAWLLASVAFDSPLQFPVRPKADGGAA